MLRDLFKLIFSTSGDKVRNGEDVFFKFVKIILRGLVLDNDILSEEDKRALNNTFVNIYFKNINGEVLGVEGLKNLANVTLRLIINILPDEVFNNDRESPLHMFLLSGENMEEIDKELRHIFHFIFLKLVPVFDEIQQDIMKDGSDDLANAYVCFIDPFKELILSEFSNIIMEQNRRWQRT